MCLAVPFKVVEKKDTMAITELEGITREISIVLTPEVEPGDWVLVHAGFAIHIIPEDDALETLQLLGELYERDLPWAVEKNSQSC